MWRKSARRCFGAKPARKPARIPKRHFRPEGNFPVFSSVAQDVAPSRADRRLVDLESFAAGSNNAGGFPVNTSNNRSPKPHTFRPVDVDNKIRAKVDAESNPGLEIGERDRLSMRELQSRYHSKNRMGDIGSAKIIKGKVTNMSLRDAAEESTVDDVIADKPFQDYLSETYTASKRHYGKGEPKNMAPAREELGMNESAKDISDMREDPRYLDTRDKDSHNPQEQNQDYRKKSVFEVARDDGALAGISNVAKKTKKTFTTPEENYKKFFQDRDRKLDGKQKRFDEILAKLPDYDMQDEGSDKKPLRMGKKQWWYRRTEKELQEKVRRDDINDILADLKYNVPFMRTDELKRMMIFDAHRVRKGEVTLNQDLWSRFVMRAYEVSIGKPASMLMPIQEVSNAWSERKIARCAVKSTLRFLQAIASVQYFPETSGSMSFADRGSIIKSEFYVSNVRNMNDRLGKRLPALDPLLSEDRGGKSSKAAKDRSPTTHGTTTGDDVELQLQPHIYRKMLFAMLQRCGLETPLHHTQYFFLLQVYARLRTRDMRVLEVILQRMSVCWALLSTKQLVKTANCVAKLGLGNNVWAKPLSKALEIRLFGDLRVNAGARKSSTAGTDSPILNGSDEKVTASGIFNSGPRPLTRDEAANSSLANYPFLWSGDGVAVCQQHHEDFEARRHDAPVHLVEPCTVNEGSSVLPQAAPFVTSILKPVTVFELIPHRAVDVLKAIISVAGDGDGKRSVNYRNLVLYELFLEVKMPTLYQNEFDDFSREAMEEIRNTFYEKKEFEAEEADDHDPSTDESSENASRIIPHAEFRVETPDGKYLHVATESVRNSDSARPREAQHDFAEIESCMQVGPFQVDFFSEEKNLIIDILSPESYYRNSVDLTATSKWRYELMLGMGYEVKTLDWHELEHKKLRA